MIYSCADIHEPMIFKVQLVRYSILEYASALDAA